jgi:hypothetical protein
MKPILKTILIIIGVGVVLLLAIQLIPVNHTNPPVVTQVKWDSPQTQALFDRACADCHSNQTVWPWYSKIAPVSWLVARDVTEGRQRWNISDLAGTQNTSRFEREGGSRTGEISRVIESGRMPMSTYLMMHPTANLTAAEKQALVTGLQATLSATQAAQ